MASLASTAWAEGNLSVYPENGVLYIVGDKAANEVIVAQYDDPETEEIGDSATIDGGQGLHTSEHLTSIKDPEGNEIDPSSVLVNFESP